MVAMTVLLIRRNIQYGEDDDDNDDSGQVSLSSQKRKAPLPDNPQRFDFCVCVLGQQSFTSGRRYWVVQVRAQRWEKTLKQIKLNVSSLCCRLSDCFLAVLFQVGEKTDWDLGVARKSINRKGAITVRPDSGYWAICRRKGGSLSACASPSVTLHLQEIPQKVGVFVDYEEGLVSFYNVDAKTHIYTYSGCAFAEPLHPYFNPCVQDNGRNATPLIICPVEGRVREEQSIAIESDVWCVMRKDDLNRYFSSFVQIGIIFEPVLVYLLSYCTATVDQHWLATSSKFMSYSCY